ncbi:hypothetical protein NADFUDRAFT_64473 [Nadsonia fulvescens var. elongata DSM 6958]|uniref:Pre-mRNA-splicing factor CEF1 n=1 Tax=Nadsonia fulvescens var. elongata DSM 6958 TaxID=857566 RepID=A0A1E3PPU1_9ASCO|nr:hypothetical protein NADFUDRAFT_64473 [Nadsonia fulvescens var. elongata DSM 6958]
MAPFVRGGVWTNVEDEILRAAISKYGLNQWSRVSSLLARKTAKQCKARWNEWLDPSVKKIEWSREEDEKLLHLAKIMPTQWRTIAPIVGRTASQCIERYQKLLDDAEQKDNVLSLTGVGSESQASLGSRKWRVGDIDPTPETKPARPDAIDMDEDELEMLSEARARLANTQGKKAKRKDRERLLEESRRLALLQKRRELKQAGINTRLGKKKKNEMDYNADIPFEHKPAVGFYSTSEEQGANEAAKLQFRRKKFSNELPENDNKKDKKRERGETKESATQRAAQMRTEKLLEMQDADQASKRRKLVLPSPQVEDSEFENIVKMGSKGEEVKEKYSGADTVTGTLIGDYQATPLPQTTRAFQVTSQNEDRLYQATREARIMTGNQISLLSNEAGEPIVDTENPFAKPDKLPSNRKFPTTETPRRDGLGVNQSEIGATPSEVLRRSFMSLPKPKNDFEIVLPDDEKLESIPPNLNNVPEDLGERERANEKMEKEAYEKSLQKRSETLKRELPRPANIVDTLPSIINHSNTYAQASIMVDNEMRDLINSDNKKYPLEKDLNSRTDTPVLPELDNDVKAKAEAEIKLELENNVSKEYMFSRYLDIYKNETNLLCKADQTENASLRTDTQEDKIQESAAMPLITHLSSLAQSANKQEHKLSVLFAGYIKRHGILLKKLTEKFELLNEKKISKNVFSQLKDMEDIALRTRFDALQEEVEFLTTSERNGQLRYQDLQDIKSSLLKKF